MDHIPESSVNAKLKSMEQQLSDLEEKVTSIDAKLTQVVDAILGNPLTKAGGFIEEIVTLKDKIKKLETKLELQDKQIQEQDTFRNRFVWTGAVVVALGLIAEWVFNIYGNFKK